MREQKKYYYNNKALISKIQKYSTKDGPGIRTTVFFKGCPLKCLWCSNPESQLPFKELFSDMNKNKCIHCFKCIHICPKQALFISNNNIVKTNRDLCNACGKCVEVCPVNNYEIIGKYYSVDELLTELIKDKVFYETSGGGVTLSGGEPTMQHKFIKEISSQLKKEHIHVALDTSGYISWKILKTILQFIDLVLYDIKIIENQKHLTLTGVKNNIILKNVKNISKMGVPLYIRFSLIPSYNDSEKEINSIVNFVMNLKSVQQICILPYHKLGVGKYEKLGKEYLLRNLKPPSEQLIEEVKMIVKNKVNAKGIKVTIGA